MINVTFKTLTGETWKKAEYKTIKTARKAKERENLKYGAHLKAEAIDTETNKQVFLMV